MAEKAGGPVWDSVADDGLSRAGEAAAFLQGFCPPGSDPVWSAEAFAWKLGSFNPAGQGFLSLGISSDRIVAATSITRKRLWLDGHEVIGGEIGDTYTDAVFRRSGNPARLLTSDPDPRSYVNRSIFGRLVTETVERARAAGVELIYGTPNANSMPGYVKRLGFHQVAHVNANFLRPSLSNLAQRAGLGTLPLGGLDRLANWTARAVSSVIAPGIEVAELTQPGDDVDALWRRVRDGVDFAPVRDASWFRHRFLAHPLARYRLLGFSRRGQLQAVAAVRRFTTMSGRPLCYVADWLAPTDTRLLARVLAEMAWRDANGTDGILLWASPRQAIAHAAKASLFLRRASSPMIVADTPAGLSLAAGRPHIDFTLAASDNV